MKCHNDYIKKDKWNTWDEQKHSAEEILTICQFTVWPYSSFNGLEVLEGRQLIVSFNLCCCSCLPLLISIYNALTFLHYTFLRLQKAAKHWSGQLLCVQLFASKSLHLLVFTSVECFFSLVIKVLAMFSTGLHFLAVCILFYTCPISSCKQDGCGYCLL